MMARVVSLQGSAAQAGIMIRETLNSVRTTYTFSIIVAYLHDGADSTGASSSHQSLGAGIAVWISWREAGMYSRCTVGGWRELVAAGTSQTVSMAPTCTGAGGEQPHDLCFATATFDRYR